MTETSPTFSIGKGASDEACDWVSTAVQWEGGFINHVLVSECVVLLNCVVLNDEL